jgi:hypothetical protein
VTDESYAMKIRIALLLSLLVLVGGSGINLQAKERCSEAEAHRAELEASSLANWHAVFASYKRYAHCDDGGIAEAYSASIASLLANRWPLINDLAALADAHPSFRRFVLKHLDETMTDLENRRIKANITARCTSRGRRVCAAIGKRLEELDDSH